jgi:DNA polymerase (family 10)
MQNSEIADLLNTTSRLMELHGENSFKARSYQSASFRIDKMKLPLQNMNEEELSNTEGIGQSLGRKIFQILNTGTFPELEELLNKTPDGVMEMMQIKGIGPKKVAVLWKELGVESPGELLYACNENRLLALKGFGAKTQEQIIKSIEFKNAAKGQFLYPDAELSGQELAGILKTLSGISNISESGELRRRCEIVTLLEYVISPAEICSSVQAELRAKGIITSLLQGESDSRLQGTTEEGIPFLLHFCNDKVFVSTLWTTTGSVTHIARMQDQMPALSENLLMAKDEEEVYKLADVHFVIPEMREAETTLLPLTNKAPAELVSMASLQGILHNHSNWSDGINTLEEMAEGCKSLHKTYFGICDHSRSAVYANGLSAERVKAQHLEIEQLNQQLAPFKIFKGIESDILTDGSLDYPEEVLASFDFVVASVHSGFRMDEQRATERLIKAIHNPYTTILGHCTGRLLLSRPGYPIDHKAVIDACAEAGVILELNAHPYRLDIDWRWIEYALSKNVMISINPDAHSVEGFHSLYYGVNSARKGGLPVEMTFNARPLEFVEEWFKRRKQQSNGGLTI